MGCLKYIYTSIHIHLLAIITGLTVTLNKYLLHYRPVIEDQEEAVNARRLKKSLTMYSSFDWGKVPRIQQRRTSEAAFGNPEIITRIYR